ncbi:Hsp70 family protein [Glycomyces tritici]|uniref:Hsp70 family protein n=1 Tax=Glycomyces tritici TaxID=2665176 RepID=A0ABT7YVM5_9ACTN|nr:Hsp70 family protein [Glycomyces tritici]MDN3242669.1 Hsp70 family protein [Glycomyces tritici]
MSFSSPRPASISVDFGTSHTVATIRRADGRVHQQLFDGSPQLPSAVFMNDEGGPVVGADAVHSGRRKPERYEPNPKRRIDDAQILLGETEIPVTSVIAAVLSRVARECEQTLGSLGPVTVTVPAAWGPTRRHVVADAATAAGLGAVDLVAEPVAAASYFVETIGANVPPGSGVVVYDLGGGTFDATVLRRATTGFDVLAVDGADDLGGLDFDQALAEHVAKTVQPDDERWQRLTNPTEPADLRHRTAFIDEVRQAKERLSRSASTELTIPLLDVDAHLTREELEQVCAPLVERTIRVTQGVIRESGLAKEQVAALFLVGAASRMPLVATLLHRELGIAPSAIEQPELAVSEGGLLAQHTVNTPISVPSPALPPQTAVPVPPAPAPSPVSAPTGQTMRLPHPSAPPMTSQPTPQAVPGMPPLQLTQPHMAAPTGPPAGPPTGQYPTGPVAPQQGPWIKSKQGIAVLVSAAAAILLVIGALAAMPYLTKDKEDDPTSASDSQQQSEEAGEAADTEATEDDTDGSASTGDDDGLVPLADAVQGDLTARMESQHVGAITQIETAQLDGANVVLTGGEDGMVRIWNPADGSLIDEYRGHNGVIQSLGVVTETSGRVAVFSSDGNTDDTWYLDDPATSVADRESMYDTIYWYGLWDGTPAYATDYQVKQLFTGNTITDIDTYYGDGLAFTEVGGTLRAVCHYENRVIVTDLTTGDPVVGTFDQLQYDIMALAVGQAAGKSLGVTVTGEGVIQAWDLAAAEPFGAPAQELYQTVTGLGLIEIDGKAAVLASGDKGLSLFDLETGTAIGEGFASHTGEEALTGAAVTEVDGRQVVVTGTAMGQVEVWAL